MAHLNITSENFKAHLYLLLLVDLFGEFQGKKMINQIATLYNKVLCLVQKLDFIAPLAIRLYLVPIFWMAGTNKYNHFQDTVSWFGNSDWGLGLPFPEVMAALATGTEIAGAICLLLGIATRLISLPLLFTMFIAIVFVHWDNDWLAISANSSEAAQRLSSFLAWLLETHPERYAYLTAIREPAMLNNGIEFATTYSIMLITLVFYGPGKYISLDYWLSKRFPK